MNRIYQIFGMRIKVDTFESSAGAILHNELSQYPIERSKDYDIAINYVSDVEKGDVISSNPTLNWLSGDGMICQLGSATVQFVFEEHQLVKINFSINRESSLKRNIRKWKSIQYATDEEAIGQIFHELLLVPMAFFEKDYSVVHSSGVVNGKGDVVLFGGTGGVGKTSLEMDLCLNHKCTFFNDDIAVVDSEGNCFPNFSYPKIYGYNLQGVKQIKEKILGDLSLANRIHYSLHELKGKNKVRRRVSPAVFYGQVSNSVKKISSFVVLFRSKVEKIKMEVISAEKAAIFNSIIMSTEYDLFFNHLRWHEFNALSMGQKPASTFDSIIGEITDNIKRSLDKADQIYMAHIPLGISNSDYKVQMVEALKKNGLI